MREPCQPSPSKMRAEQCAKFVSPNFPPRPKGIKSRGRSGMSHSPLCLSNDHWCVNGSWAGSVSGVAIYVRVVGGYVWWCVRVVGGTGTC